MIVERNNTIIDGNGHMLSGNGVAQTVFLNNVRNVTVKNLIIKDYYGISVFLDRCSNVTVSGNTITETCFKRNF